MHVASPLKVSSSFRMVNMLFMWLVFYLSVTSEMTSENKTISWRYICIILIWGEKKNLRQEINHRRLLPEIWKYKYSKNLQFRTYVLENHCLFKKYHSMTISYCSFKKYHSMTILFKILNIFLCDQHPWLSVVTLIS